MQRDLAYLADMLIAARRISTKISGNDADSFSNDLDLQDIIIRQLGIIGEAANHVSDALRDQNPDIPWHKIVAVRHRVIHEYSQVDLNRIWRIAANEIPPLIRQLEKLVDE
jgi:uncharacterized protein with HEPN domain